MHNKLSFFIKQFAEHEEMFINYNLPFHEQICLCNQQLL